MRPTSNQSPRLCRTQCVQDPFSNNPRPRALSSRPLPEFPKTRMERLYVCSSWRSRRSSSYEGCTSSAVRARGRVQRTQFLPLLVGFLIFVLNSGVFTLGFDFYPLLQLRASNPASSGAIYTLIAVLSLVLFWFTYKSGFLSDRLAARINTRFSVSGPDPHARPRDDVPRAVGLLQVCAWNRRSSWVC